MITIDVYNEKITVYGTIDPLFVLSLLAIYIDFEVEYKTHDFDGPND